MLFYEIRARLSDRHNQISDCQNPENTQSMTMTGRLFPGLVFSMVGISSQAICGKANQVLGLIQKMFGYKNLASVKLLLIFI